MLINWTKPITDRTAADVAYAQANRASPEPLKGARNLADLNRIASNCKILYDTLTENGYLLLELKQRLTPWTKNEWPNAQDIQNIIDDVQMMKDRWATFVELPTPVLPINAYQKMNDLEQILVEIELWLSRMIAAMRYCDTFYCGEV